MSAGGDGAGGDWIVAPAVIEEEAGGTGAVGAATGAAEAEGPDDVGFEEGGDAEAPEGFLAVDLVE